MKDGKRLHYGVMFSTMDNANQYELWRGINSFAKEKDIHLTAYIGTYQVAGGPVTSFLDTCFETAAASGFLDGIIVFSGFVSQNVGIEKFNEYLNKIPQKVPIVSASLPLPGVPSVMAESFGGMYTTVAHMIKGHGKKRIVFVKGTEGHPEAEARLDGYKKALADNGFEFDERYVLPGYFNTDSGEEAVSTIVDTLKLKFDAIVASNDQMAMGVLTELKNRGILVPTDVAVTGFDDDVTSAYLVPSLSTARQDFFEIGHTCAETLFTLINGGTADDIINVTPVFVPRQSCGCLEEEYAESVQILSQGTTLRGFVLEHFKPLFESVPEEQIAEWAEVLVRAIGKSSFSQKKFLYLFNQILIKYNRYYKEIMRWHAALDILSAGIEFHSYEVESLQAVHSALISATAFVHDIRGKEEKNKDIRNELDREFVRRLTSELVLTFDLDFMVDKLFAALPARELSMHTALIGLYRTPIKPGDKEIDHTIETLIGFDGDKKINIRQSDTLLSSYPDLDEFDMERERRSMFFLPLFFEEVEMGVLMLPYGDDILVDAYDTLRVSIATAIKGAELLSTIRTLSITDELTGLLNRRGFFQFVYTRLYPLARSPGATPMVMFMDMDGLKAINDTFGHNEGDAAIMAFAKVLKDALRKEDIIGRIGGDEFVVFSQVKSQKNGKQVVKRIREKLEEYNSRGLHPYAVSVSIGSVILEEASRECFEEAILGADSVLYEEKQRKKKSGLSRG